ncbi:MAG: glycosyltransferase, partial [Chloroflexota bacterium]
VSISGPEPHRSLLERAVLRQLPALGRSGVLALGRPGPVRHWRTGTWEVYSYLDRADQGRMMHACRLAIVRAGYTTLMELAQAGKPAVLIPTPGQTEQEYLAAYHQRLGHHVQARQQDLSLPDLLTRGLPVAPYAPPHLTDVSVGRFLNALFER